MLDMSSMIMDWRTFSTVAARLRVAWRAPLAEYTKGFKFYNR